MEQQTWGQYMWGRVDGHANCMGVSWLMFGRRNAMPAIMLHSTRHQGPGAVPLNHALDVRQLRLLRLFSLQLRKWAMGKQHSGGKSAVL